MAAGPREHTHQFCGPLATVVYIVDQFIPLGIAGRVPYSLAASMMGWVSVCR